ncbi:hypothetical protein VST7929_00717 [Vibrio stylophorae]|uniref:Metal-dependent hydrolase n=1 Tax=Vibrio stylophorae TaxID=659351 RepID=A0ABN8DSU7_9VIBR|nr:alanyl-tRNA editing protein [Vibrio stylophorae]CAH0532870.1 hypothetical protein VST7929_00717 [Vibrio stylophorae]
MSVRATEVLFPLGIDQAKSQVIYSQCHQDARVIVCQQTPFHPVSHIWPDHPADRGEIICGSEIWPVNNCIIGAWSESEQRLYLAQDIPVKRDEPGWQFVVAHLIGKEAPCMMGQMVTLKVDRHYQQSLSLAHSAEHLVSMALNLVLAQSHWRKDPGRYDPLGSPDFHRYAQLDSQIRPLSSEVNYRLGKTLRKRGFNTHEATAELPQIEQQVNLQLAQWLSEPTAIHLHCEGPRLTDSRYWQCELNQQLAAMPCGGTHARNLSDFSTIQIRIIECDLDHWKVITEVQVARIFTHDLAD